MPLPEMIEIEPLPGPVAARVSVPGSKSITNRAMVLAALANGETRLHGALWSEDTEVMVECLRELGFMVNLGADPRDESNRMVTVYGLGGKVPPGGTETQPLSLFVGNAGTVARFLTAFLCLGKGVYRLHGVPRMHERPQAALMSALRQLGYRLDSPNDRLPVTIWGGGPRPGHCAVSILESSQFASALMLCAATAGWQVKVTGENAEESPYVAMTAKLVEAFPREGGSFRVEADASSASYFVAADMLLGGGWGTPPPSLITLTDPPQSDWQIDNAFRAVIETGPARVSRQKDLGDSILSAMILAPFAKTPIVFSELERLRVQECERVAAMKAELTKCGIRVDEEGQSLTIFPADKPRGATIETYNDHRIAMCFGILGLKLSGMKIQNPACVKKTFPNFFQKLAAAPPGGLGAVVREGSTRRRLAAENLVAG